MQGAVQHRSLLPAQGQAAEGFSDELMDLRGELAQVNLAPNRETFALLTELYILAGDIKASLSQINSFMATNDSSSHQLYLLVMVQINVMTSLS